MKKLLSLVLALALALSVAGCGTAAESQPSSVPAESAAASVPEASAPSAPSQAAAVPTVDRAGTPITLPDEVKTVISMAPSITQTLVDLGCKDMIIAADSNSIANVEGLSELPGFDMMAPDVEKMGSLTPDVVLVSGLSMWDGSEPFKPLQDMGITFVQVPTSATIDDIYKDIEFIGGVVGKSAEAKKINADLKARLDEIAKLGTSIPEDKRKTVYFEIANAPSFYSTGSNTYLDEMITLVGGKNVMADQDSWISVSAENIAAANPDVILTNTNYVPDAVGDLLKQEGWSEVTAIANKDVYYIDNMSSSLPNENIVLALEEMGQALYPDVFTK